MAMYLVTWSIDIDADSPEEAAAKALIVQRDNNPANTAVVFHVKKHGALYGKEVDLSDKEG